MKSGKKLILLSLFLMSLLMLGACSSTYDIKVEMASSMRMPSGIFPTYELDFVGLTDSEKPRIEAYTVDEYFSPDNSFRANVQKYTMRFSDSNAGPFTLKKDNPIWQKWKKRGVTSILVISNLPGVWKNLKGNADCRKLNLPLDPDRWPNGRDITITVNPGGLVLQSPLLPPGKKKSWW